MFCSQCGNQIPDGQNFCNVCGAPIQQSGYQQPQYQQPQYQQANGYQQNQRPAYQPKLGMKWFNFIIWVQLFIGSASYVYQGFQLFTGGIYTYEYYGNMSARVYEMFPNMEVIDKGMAILSIVMAILAIIARFTLASFRKLGVQLYFTYIIVGLAFGILYPLLGSSILGVPFADVMDARSWGALTGWILLLIVNSIYFKNRKHLFH